jgi:oxygen-independent coproporphyrinogen-3 oxidase
MVETMLASIDRLAGLTEYREITLEANPGTLSQCQLHAYHKAGVNRLSLGIQSLNDDSLNQLGRIHNRLTALQSALEAREAGFDNLNLDLMFGLPHQSLSQALTDLEIAVSLAPAHLSWYQLTLEPNTLFYHQPPVLPAEELIEDIQQQGTAYLENMGYQQYEVSAFSRPGAQCQHNLTYWTFGDYLGIGAGAHGKIRHPSGQHQRSAKPKAQKLI